MKKILIIEDSKAYASIISAYLHEEIGAEFTVAKSKAEAVAELELARDDYFLATIDLHLPDATRAEIVEITEKFNIPGIVFTGDINGSLREDILSFDNVCDYVLKNGPNALEYVAQTIKRLYTNTNTHALVVDDSRLSRQMLKRSLATQLLNVSVVDSAEKALEFLKEHGDVQLVIADGELEGMDGIQLTTEIRRTRGLKDLAVIGISGTYNRTKSIEFLKAGANDFLAKPFQFEELNTRVNHNLSTMSQMRELDVARDNQQMLLNMAAHDIRNPLANIVSLTDMIKANPASSEKYLSLISRASNELLSLVTGIVEYSKMSTAQLGLHFEYINCDSLISELLPELSHIAANKQISVALEHNDLEVKVDKRMMRQVLKNLVNNAIKFSPSDTQVTIQCEKARGYRKIKVIDQGQGIPASERNKLFIPFSNISVKPTANEASAGLGLALCKQLVDAQNADFGVEDTDSGVGICFYIKFPY